MFFTSVISILFPPFHSFGYPWFEAFKKVEEFFKHTIQCLYPADRHISDLRCSELHDLQLIPVLYGW